MARRRYQKGSVALRGNKWVGRWREDVVSPTGVIERVNRKRILGTKQDFKTKREAQRSLDLILAPINSLDYRPTFQITFGEFAERWMKTVLPQAYQLSTQDQTKKQLNAKLLPTFREIALKDITTEMLQMYVGHLITDCGVSAKYVRNLLSTMSGMWRQALTWKYVSHDPFKGLILPKSDSVKSRVYSLEETLAIIEAANEPFKTFIWILAETGMRPGEVCGLDWANVDLDNRIIAVTQKAWQGHLQRPKTASSIRRFTISPQLADHLREQKGTGLLFTTPAGKPWQVSHTRIGRLEPLLDRLGIERKGLHAFRHFNATMMDRFNTPVKTRQSRLGHSDPRVTLGLQNRGGYTHMVSEDDRRVAQQLGEVLRRNASKQTEAAVGAD